MEVLSYQLFFLVAIILSSLLGRGARNIVVIGSIVFTLIMVFTMPLALLQLFTIAIGFSLSEGIINRSETREREGESGWGCIIFIILIVIYAIIGIIDNVYFDGKQGEISSYYYIDTGQKRTNNTKPLEYQCILYTKDEHVEGYIYQTTDSMPIKYVFYGKKNGSKIIGNRYLIKNKFSDIKNLKSEFNIIESQKSIVIHFENEKLTVPKYNSDLFISSTKTIYESPWKTSEIIVEDYNLKNKGFKLLEIRSRDKTRDIPKKEMVNYNGLAQYEVWFQIKNDDYEGWVLGGLDGSKQ
jgi:hypothetical protein